MIAGGDSSASAWRASVPELHRRPAPLSARRSLLPPVGQHDADLELVALDFGGEARLDVEMQSQALANIRERLALHFDVEASPATKVEGDKFEIRIVPAKVVGEAANGQE